MLGDLGTSYQYYQPPFWGYDQPIALADTQPGATTPGIVSVPQVTATTENAGGDWSVPIGSYPLGGVSTIYLGNSLTYSPDAGFTGTDSLTVSAYGSNASGSSATTTSTLLLDVLPQVAPPAINSPYSVNAGVGGVAIFNNTGTNAFPSAIRPGTGTIQVSLQLASGTLTLGSTTGVSIDSGANGSDSITFTGTVAEVNNALDGLQYTSLDDAAITSDVLTINVSDLGHNSFDQPEVAQQQVLINNNYFIQPTGTQYVAPGSNVVFNVANGNTLAVLPHGSDQEELQISDSQGTLKLASTTGLTFIAGGNGQSSMTIVGSATAINNALDGLTYRPIRSTPVTTITTGSVSLSSIHRWPPATGTTAICPTAR